MVAAQAIDPLTDLITTIEDVHAVTQESAIAGETVIGTVKGTMTLLRSTVARAVGHDILPRAVAAIDLIHLTQEGNIHQGNQSIEPSASLP